MFFLMTDNSKTSTGQKIGIFGLDNAGKTTIVEVIEDQKDLGFLANLQPTIRVQIRKFLSMAPDWVIWDFGGQEIYRQEYLKMPERYFHALSLMIFVIDIQNSTRYDVALQYFSECMKCANLNSPNYQILVLLHKADPDIITTPSMQQNLKYLKGQISQLLLKHQRTANIYCSTIFNANLHLSEVGLGSLDQASTLTPMIREAKSIHRTLRGNQVDAAPKGVQAVADSGKMQKTRGTKDLKTLSLERTRMIEEFRALLRK